MEDVEMKEFANEVAKAIVVALRNDNKHFHCSFCKDEEGATRHDKAHEAFDQFMATMNRIDNIKWGVAQAIAVMIVCGISVLVWSIVKN